MSCNCGPKHGKPFDPSCEGPSQADIERFGDESEYAEFDSDSIYQDSSNAKPNAKSVMVTGVTIAVIAAFALPFLL